MQEIRFKIIYLFIIILLILSNGKIIASERLLDYGFEDWTGDIYTTPGYIYSSNYASYMVIHDNASDVISSYYANEMSQTWTPHTGNYFWLQNDSPDFPLSPSISGITAGTVQAHNNIGLNGTYGGTNPLDISFDITTGEIFIRFWARNNCGFSTIQDGGRCKWIFVATDGGGGIYMHLATNTTSPSMYFYHADEGYWLGSGVTLIDAYDGNWHKYTFYINFNSGSIYGWYDVAEEDTTNYTKFWQAGDNQIGSCTKAIYLKIQGNFSAKHPTEETYHAIDDLEIWNGMPDTTSSIAENNNEMKIYPNHYRIYMSTNFITFNNLNSGDIVKIYNISGRLVNNSGNIDGNIYRWNISDFPLGIYLFTINGNNEINDKIVIIR